jgi:hypothetical protein
MARYEICFGAEAANGENDQDRYPGILEIRWMAAYWIERLRELCKEDV